MKIDWCINALRAKCVWENLQIYVYFLLLRDTEMAQVIGMVLL